MQEIADAAGVSKSSVSLALRDNPRLPAATRERIQRVADELGYRRNPVVDSLMTQLRNGRAPTFQGNLALLNCSADRKLRGNPTFDAFRRGIRDRAEALGYGVEEYWLEEPGLRPERLRQILDTRNIRGLVLVAALVPHELHERYRDFWGDFACAVVGVTHLENRLPCATNDQYLTAKQATEKTLARGYRRPGLAVERKIDELLDFRFSAGFHVGARGLSAENRLPPFPLDLDDPAGFVDWVAEHRPDALVTNQAVVRDWLAEAGWRVPEDIGLVHLDWHPGLSDWAGMQQNNYRVAAAGADLVVHQLQKNECGPHDHPKVVALESDWVDGPSLE